MFSVVIPVYRNEGSLEAVVAALERLHTLMHRELEAVFVIDGSPDRSRDLLAVALPGASFPSQLVVLSRNFGSFPAILAGFAHGSGPYYAVMAADLQEPPELLLEFREKLLGGQVDVVVGTRASRDDPFAARLAATVYWRLYRRIVQKEMPRGGVDVFACNRVVRDHLLELQERNTTLVGLLLWVGFRRAEVSYARRRRRHGRSSWSLTRRVRYLLDSVFAFSDLPVRLLSLAGMLGMALSVSAGLVVVFYRISGGVDVPGYTATILTVMFFGGLNSFGLGLIGEYLWRAFENTKRRPAYIVAEHSVYGKEGEARAALDLGRG